MSRAIIAVLTDGVLLLIRTELIGSLLAALVHPVRREGRSRLLSRYSVYYTSAFWDGRMMVFGEGLPPGLTTDRRSCNYMSAALDLVAHELTLGVTDFPPQPDLPERVRRAR